MSFVRSVAGWVMRSRLKRLEEIRKDPARHQLQLFQHLIEQGRNTSFGKQFDFKSIRNPESFRQRIPVSGYESFYPWIERTLRGESHVLWPGKTTWFSKSSGTTNAKSKFIPVTEDSLRLGHYKGGQDMVAAYADSRPGTRIFSGKQLSLGGSLSENPYQPGSFIGDVSAVLMRNLPWFYARMRTPAIETALLEEWEEKIEKIAGEILKQDIRSASGVPTWMLVLFHRLLELSGRTDLTQLYPGFEVFFHGGVSFLPYEQNFRKLLPGKQVRFFETYNASEGFFAIQDDPDEKGLLLLADHGIYYEFIPLNDFQNGNEAAVGMEAVEKGKVYTMVISTNGGLWRYMPGDTVRFVSTYPHRIVVSGRTRSFINAFGEELMVENADSAILFACQSSACEIEQYTAAPVYFSDTESGAHEWLIEFRHPPENLEHFCYLLDEKLKQLNSDYEAKRHKNMALSRPHIRVVKPGFFAAWLKSQNRMGVQAKIARLNNDREMIEQMIAYGKSEGLIASA